MFIDYLAELTDISVWLEENSNASRDASAVIDEVTSQLKNLKMAHEKLQGDYENLKELYHAAAISIEDLDRAHRVIDYLIRRCLELENNVKSAAGKANL